MSEDSPQERNATRKVTAGAHPPGRARVLLDRQRQRLHAPHRLEQAGHVGRRGRMRACLRRSAGALAAGPRVCHVPRWPFTSGGGWSAGDITHGTGRARTGDVRRRGLTRGAPGAVR